MSKKYQKPTIWSSFGKVVKVIDSMESATHYLSALKMIRLFSQMHNDYSLSIELAERLDKKYKTFE